MARGAYGGGSVGECGRLRRQLLQKAKARESDALRAQEEREPEGGGEGDGVEDVEGDARRVHERPAAAAHGQHGAAAELVARARDEELADDVEGAACTCERAGERKGAFSECLQHARVKSASGCASRHTDAFTANGAVARALAA